MLKEFKHLLRVKRKDKSLIKKFFKLYEQKG